MARPGGAKKIWYACVARGGVVAAEESGCAGNANLVAAQLLEKLEEKPSTSNRCSFAQDGQLFHVLISRQMKGVTCICMADEVHPPSLLANIHRPSLTRQDCRAPLSMSVINSQTTIDCWLWFDSPWAGYDAGHGTASAIRVS